MTLVLLEVVVVRVDLHRSVVVGVRVVVVGQKNDQIKSRIGTGRVHCRSSLPLFHLLPYLDQWSESKMRCRDPVWECCARFFLVRWVV